MEIVMLSVTLSSMTSLLVVSVMVWGSISMEGHRHHHRQQPDCHEILEPTVRPYANAVGPGLVLVIINAGLMCKSLQALLGG